MLNGIKVSSLSWADDLLLISTTKRGLQNCLDKVHAYSQKWSLTVNTTKSKCMTVASPSSKDKNSSKFYYGHTCLDSVAKFTYLGITLNKHGNFKTAIKDRILKANRAIFLIKQAFSVNSTCISPKIALKIFDTQIKPILTYGSVLWGLPRQSNYIYCDGIKEEANIKL